MIQYKNWLLDLGGKKEGKFTYSTGAHPIDACTQPQTTELGSCATGSGPCTLCCLCLALCWRITPLPHLQLACVPRLGARLHLHASQPLWAPQRSWNLVQTYRVTQGPRNLAQGCGNCCCCSPATKLLDLWGPLQTGQHSFTTPSRLVGLGWHSPDLGGMWETVHASSHYSLKCLKHFFHVTGV